VVWSEAGALQSASYIQGKSIVKELLAILIGLPESNQIKRVRFN